MIDIGKQYKLIFDDNILDEYLKYYFKKYPRRHKIPIDSPLHPSINKWFVMKRPQMNDLKQKWKEFGVWVVKKYGYDNLNIQHAKITYRFFFKTKRRQDNDNRSPKFINDALTESHMIIDDNYTYLNPLIIYGEYDKEHPRMEIIIEEY